MVFAGQGDAQRSLSLLWRGAQATARPGPKQGLTVDAIVSAAIAVADESGMSALSMRAVGERLGRTAMALYTYVPNKSELLDLMYDRAFAELTSPAPADDGWRAAVTAWAEQLWDFYVRHPWVLQVSQARPVLGPNEFGSMETIAAILRDTGLPPSSVRPVVSALAHLVRGAAQAMAESREAAASTGMTDETWWYARSAVLQEIAPDLTERYPALMWMESDVTEPDDGSSYLEHQVRTAFVAGLGVLLDGVEAAIGRAAR